MFVILSLLLSSLHAQATTPNQLGGSWLNEDPSTLGVSHILITDEEGRFRLRAWGNCEPEECDFGTTDAHFSGEAATGIFQAGPIKITMFLVRLPDERLLAVTETESDDTPNFHDKDRAEFFVREEPLKDAKSISARKLLKEVAETYRNLPPAQFESERISDSGNAVAITREKIMFSPPDKLRAEISGSGESQITILSGQTFWSFFPESNEYTTHTTNTTRPEFNHYGSLDQIAGSAVISGSERLGDVDCTIVTIERPNRTRTLWIDPKNHYVLKDKMINTSVLPPIGAISTTTITFSVARTVASFDDRLFLFDPRTTEAKSRLAVQKEALEKSVGAQAPDFSLSDLNGKQMELSHLTGKAVLLNFWSSWCVPCRAELPTIELLHRQFKDKGLVVLGIDEEQSQVQRAFLQSSGFSFPSLVEPKRQASNLFGVGGIPTTVLIDQGGKIRAFNQGIASYEELRKTLKEMGMR